jgi:hypothetical protein
MKPNQLTRDTNPHWYLDREEQRYLMQRSWQIRPMPASQRKTVRDPITREILFRRPKPFREVVKAMMQIENVGLVLKNEAKRKRRARRGK